jgi:hypothetical protein
MSKIRKEEEKQLRISANVHPVPTDKKRRSANIPLIGYVAFVVILIVGLVGTAKTLGWYGTSGKVSSSGKAITLTASSTGSELKGWMTLESFLKAFGITKQQFEKEFNVPAGLDSSETLGELGKVTDELVSMEILRTWVDAGHTLSASKPANSAAAASTATPTSAPQASTSVTSETSSKPSNTATAPSSPRASTKPATSDSPSPQGSPTGTGGASNSDSSGEFVIKGRTTIQEVLDETKFSKTYFYTQFNIPESFPASSPLSTIKDVVPDFEITVIHDWFASLK